MPNMLCALRRMSEPTTIVAMVEAGHKMAMICGHLGREPQTKYAPSGKPVCSSTMAVSWGKRGENQTTEWIDLEAWEDQAELLQQYSKGKCLICSGAISVREWEGRGGQTRKQGKMSVWLMGPADYKRREQAPASQGQATQPDDDIPF